MKHILILLLFSISADMMAQTIRFKKLKGRNGSKIVLNGAEAHGISNDPSLADSSAVELVTEAAAKAYADGISSGSNDWNDLQNVPVGFADGVDNSGTDDQNAGEVSFTPTGGISSTDVQGMGAELDAEKTEGSGTAGRLAKWTGPNGLGDSGITESGGNVGIGTASPSSRLTLVETDTTPSLTVLQSNTLTKTLSSNNPNAEYIYDLVSHLGGTGGHEAATNIHSRVQLSSSAATNRIRSIQGRVNVTGAGSADFIALLSTHFEGSGTGTVNNLYGVKVGDGYGASAFANAANTITNTYGMYVGDITAGNQTNTPYAFYSSDTGSHNYFAGRTGFGTSLLTEAVEVLGNVRLTGKLMPGTVDNATTDTDKFLVDDGTEIKHRTGPELLSDLDLHGTTATVTVTAANTADAIEDFSGTPTSSQSALFTRTGDIIEMVVSFVVSPDVNSIGNTFYIDPPATLDSGFTLADIDVQGDGRLQPVVTTTPPPLSMITDVRADITNDRIEIVATYGSAFGNPGDMKLSATFKYLLK